MSDPEIRILNRSEAQAFTSTQPYAIIGATDPDVRLPAYVPSPWCRKVLNLRFNDVPHQCCTRHTLFAAEHVAEVVAFARWLRTEAAIEILVVHCEAGISRSSAIALALARSLGKDIDTVLAPGARYRPNAFVYWRLARTLMPGREAELVDELFRWTAEHAHEMLQPAQTWCA